MGKKGFPELSPPPSCHRFVTYSYSFGWALPGLFRRFSSKVGLPVHFYPQKLDIGGAIVYTDDSFSAGNKSNNLIPDYEGTGWKL